MYYSFYIYVVLLPLNSWKVSVFRVFLVCIFLHSDWIRTRKTPNTDTFHAVTTVNYYPISGQSSHFIPPLKTHTEKEMKFFINDFFSKCDQILRKVWMWSHLLKKFLTENFIFCAVTYGDIVWGHIKWGYCPELG